MTIKEVYESSIYYLTNAGLESLLEKMSTCHNNPGKSSTTKINEHAPSSYSLFTHFSFDKTKHKLDPYRGKDCMERFYKDLKEHATKIINNEKKKKEMIPLTSEEKKLHGQQKKCIHAKKYLVLMMITKYIIKSEIIVITLEKIEELLMIFAI